ncbi:hypothetical protein BD310DRAFT_115049 [Dichomitus squalens]|uniref:Uncharacterized protein n=1 Tax=Dichomitus squalens TaxID=114155 RepID=A0A4Q9Q4J8_9APHY|nr:hypothetical protein BD310DRAFT_115049 [Dichomitus squalens]
MADGCLLRPLCIEIGPVESVRISVVWENVLTATLPQPSSREAGRIELANMRPPSHTCAPPLVPTVRPCGDVCLQEGLVVPVALVIASIVFDVGAWYHIEVGFPVDAAAAASLDSLRPSSWPTLRRRPLMPSLRPTRTKARASSSKSGPRPSQSSLARCPRGRR